MTQYSASGTNSSSRSAPVTFDAIGIEGVRYLTVFATSRNASVFQIDERRMERVRDPQLRGPRPRPARIAASSSIARVSPESTTCVGPLTVASETRSECAATSSATSASLACTASIVPPSGSASINRPR